MRAFEDFDLQYLRKKLGENGQLSLNVISQSMEPFIKKGDVVIVKEGSNFKPFDVIVYKQGQQLFCHFYLDQQIINGETFVSARGLNDLKQIEHPISPNHILGQVVNYELGLLKKIYYAIKIRWSS